MYIPTYNDNDDVNVTNVINNNDDHDDNDHSNDHSNDNKHLISKYINTNSNSYDYNDKILMIE